MKLISIVATMGVLAAGLQACEREPAVNPDMLRIAQAMDRLAPDPDPALLAEAYALLEGVVVSGMVEVER